MEKEKHLNAEELSLILGISEFTVKKLARAKELPCVRGKRQIQFDLAALLNRFEQLEGGSL